MRLFTNGDGLFVQEDGYLQGYHFNTWQGDNVLIRARRESWEELI